MIITLSWAASINFNELINNKYLSFIDVFETSIQIQMYNVYTFR